MKNTVALLTLAIGLSGNLIAQENQSFNLPPGSVFHPKTFQEIDYSYKLNQLGSNGAENTEADFLKEFSKDDLRDMELNSPESHRYYITARDYYNSLSGKVKATFTIDELWYIYKFDQKLKNTLQNIK